MGLISRSLSHFISLMTAYTCVYFMRQHDLNFVKLVLMFTPFTINYLIWDKQVTIQSKGYHHMRTEVFSPLYSLQKHVLLSKLTLIVRPQPITINSSASPFISLKCKESPYIIFTLCVFQPFSQTWYLNWQFVYIPT